MQRKSSGISAPRFRCFLSRTRVILTATSRASIENVLSRNTLSIRSLLYTGCYRKSVMTGNTWLLCTYLYAVYAGRVADALIVSYRISCRRDYNWSYFAVRTRFYAYCYALIYYYSSFIWKQKWLVISQLKRSAKLRVKTLHINKLKKIKFVLPFKIQDHTYIMYYISWKIVKFIYLLIYLIPIKAYIYFAYFDIFKWIFME